MDKKITSRKTLKSYEFTVCGDSGYISLKTDDGYKQISKDGFTGDMLYAKNYDDFIKKCRLYVKTNTDSILGDTKWNYYIIKSAYEMENKELPDTFTSQAGTYRQDLTTFSKNYLQMMKNFRKERKKSYDIDDIFGIYRLSSSFGDIDRWELCQIIN